MFREIDEMIADFEEKARNFDIDHNGRMREMDKKIEVLSNNIKQNGIEFQNNLKEMDRLHKEHQALLKEMNKDLDALEKW